MSFLSLLFIPRLLTQLCSAATRVGEKKKIDLGNHILWLPGRKSVPISGLDVGCCWIIDSPTGRRRTTSAVNKRTPASRTSCTAVNANNYNNQEFDPKTPSDHYYCPLKVIYKIHFYLIISLNQYRVFRVQCVHFDVQYEPILSVETWIKT